MTITFPITSIKVDGPNCTLNVRFIWTSLLRIFYSWILQFSTSSGTQLKSGSKSGPRIAPASSAAVAAAKTPSVSRDPRLKSAVAAAAPELQQIEKQILQKLNMHLQSNKATAASEALSSKENSLVKIISNNNSSSNSANSSSAATTNLKLNQESSTSDNIQNNKNKGRKDSSTQNSKSSRSTSNNTSASLNKSDSLLSSGSSNVGKSSSSPSSKSRSSKSNGSSSSSSSSSSSRKLGSKSRSKDSSSSNSPVKVPKLENKKPEKSSSKSKSKSRKRSPSPVVPYRIPKRNNSNSTSSQGLDEEEQSGSLIVSPPHPPTFKELRSNAKQRNYVRRNKEDSKSPEKPNSGIEVKKEPLESSQDEDLRTPIITVTASNVPLDNISKFLSKKWVSLSGFGAQVFSAKKFF